ncbi:ABC transporter ATP-binding protein/permease [Bifidobacterium catulorum]|uniref:ABC transporter ATP-binding protein n=1 Tax=Bifidobacterium catulorum TaxID=1630173 RepID=A0A2U2MTD3_9BIFI|nr:ATP-binding cassette domain-containing protein [Bifidobacterium catulorum]PWG60113.1 ABC transporter ATP-binding protein [Bifidobacterium catulorum]
MFDKRLFALAPGIGRLIAGKVALMWVGLLANVAFMIAMVSMLSDVVEGVRNGTPLAGDMLAYLGVFAVAAIVRYAATRASTRLGFEAAERVKLALRERLYRKMLRLGPSYSSRVKTADVVQSAGEGVEQIQSFFELFLPQLFYAVLAPITLFVVLTPVNWSAALVLLVCAPLIVVIVGLVAMRAARVFKKYWGKYTDMGAAFLDNLQGLETLKTFDADERAARDMDRKAEEFRVMTMRVLQIQLRSLTAMDVVAYGGAAAGIGMAVWQYAHGGLGLGGGLLIVLLSAEFFIPLRQLGSYFHVAMNGMTSTKRIFALLDAPEPEHGGRTLDAAGETCLGVSLGDVGFAYGDGDADSGADGSDGVAEPASMQGSGSQALRGISFTAVPGNLTAIVGGSGSGKSTAAALLAGTLTGYTGSITLCDDHAEYELRDLSTESITKAVTLVSSRAHLFMGTLRENLLMARPDATEDELWQALHDARIDEFVDAQPQKLDMRIEQDAANLSGGQRQRIAIARALLHDGMIYIFDEATSSVDAESEAQILAVIRELARDKTVIMITHRMANAVEADTVAVFSHGRVAEHGTHGELLAAGGEYARMFRVQEAIENVGATEQTRVVRVPSDEPAENSGIEVGQESEKPRNSNDIGADAVASAEWVSRTRPHDSRSRREALIPRLLKVASPLTRFMVAACVFGTLGHLAATFLPVFGMMALFAAAGRPVWGMGVGASVAAMAVCALIRGLMRYTEQYMNHNVAFRLLALFRSRAFAALRRLAPAKLDAKGKGDLIALITTDVEMLEIFFAHTISPVVIAVSSTVVYAVALCLLDPMTALLLVGAHLVIGVGVPALFGRAVGGIGPRLRKDSSALDDQVLDGLRGVGEIIRFGVGEARVADVVSRTRDLWAQRARLNRINGHYAGLGGLLVLVFTAAAAAIAAAGVGAGARTASEAVVAVVLLASSFGPTLALSALPANLTNTFAAARRLFALMDESPAVTERGVERPDYTGMALDDVTFSYPDADAPVVAGFSLDVPRSGVLGIQGPSGRGKSTVLKLLMRYWDPQSGQVRLSDVALPRVDAHHRRRVQTMMSQETALFDGTIRENLMIALPAPASGAAPGADGDAGTNAALDLDATLREACRKASVLDLVDSLPAGLDTPVGELGDRLSEGERQRIGLARIFLRDASLVLFDEPTSRLDALNEAVILNSVNTLASERHTAIVLVSHRASTMRIAYRVVEV